MRTLLITPFLIMPVVAGLIWKNQMLNGLYGVVNWVLERVGVDSIEFVSRYPRASIIAVLVWQWTPFMMLIVLAGLQSQSSEVLEASKVDGATAFGTFRQLTLPHLRSYLELGALLGTVYLIQVFDHVAVMTGGGPDSTNLPYFVYQRSIGGGWVFGRASAYSIVVVVASIIVATIVAAGPVSAAEGRGDRVSTMRATERQRGGERPPTACVAGERSERRGDRMKGATIGVGESRSTNVVFGLLAWLAGLLFFFPVLWTVLNSFKDEQDANTSPRLLFDPTFDRYGDVTESTSGLLSFREAFTQLVRDRQRRARSSCCCWRSRPPTRSAIKPIEKWRDVLFFFISTKFLPVVASILPIWILAREFQMLNTRLVLVILYTAMNLPLAVWMLRSFFQEIPRELIEAAEIDGAGLRGQLTTVILPIAVPGIAATALLCVIFAWNEYFYAVQLNPADASTMPIWVTTNISTRGDFLAKLSAASVLASLPVVIAGWLAQKRMIRGLAMGAIK